MLTLFAKLFLKTYTILLISNIDTIRTFYMWKMRIFYPWIKNRPNYGISKCFLRCGWKEANEGNWLPASSQRCTGRVSCSQMRGIMAGVRKTEAAAGKSERLLTQVEADQREARWLSVVCTNCVWLWTSCSRCFNTESVHLSDNDWRIWVLCLFN